MSGDWIRGIPEGRSSGARLPRVRAAAWEQPVVCCLLSDDAWCRFMHYDCEAGRTVPCAGKDTCEYCPDPTTRAGGYVAALEGRARTKVICYFTDSALDALNALAQEHGHLRGLVVKTERADRRPCARMDVTFLSVVPADTLPAEFDPRPSLERMWGWSLRSIRAQRLGGGADDGARPRRRKGR